MTSRKTSTTLRDKNQSKKSRSRERTRKLFLETLEDRRLLAAEVWVDDDFNETTPGWDTTHFASINSGIAAVDDGGTVNVLPGAYTERLTIGKSLSLLGAQRGFDARGRTGAEAVVQDPDTYANPKVLIDIATGVSNVTIDGFTLQGTASLSHADNSVIRVGGSGYAAPGNPSLTISNNIIDGTYGLIFRGGAGLAVSTNEITASKTGIAVQQGPAPGASITSNTVLPAASLYSDPTGIYMTSVDGGTVSGNVASGFVSGTSGRGFQASGVQNLTVSGNTFSDARDGISIFGATTDTVQITGNTLSNNSRFGINIKGTNITITGNSFDANTTAAVSVGDTGVNSSVALSGNTYANTTTGISLVAPGSGKSNSITVSETIAGAVVGMDILGGTASVSSSALYGNTTAIRVAGGTLSLSTTDFDDSSDNTTDLRIESTAGTMTLGNGNLFAGDTFFIDNESTQSFDLSATAGTTFDETDNFRIEDKMHHRVDTDLAVGTGLITWVADNLYVTNAGTDHSIQRGIDAASGGDTVNVEAGTYSESLTANKNLTLVGDGPATTFIDGESRAGISFADPATAVTLQNLKLAGTPTALANTAGRAITLINVILIDAAPATTTIAGSSGHDNVEVRSTAGNIEVQVNGGGWTTVPSGNALAFQGLDGNDTLTVDASAGNPIPSGGISFDGGVGGSDGLVVKGKSTATTAVYTPDATTAGKGTVVIDGTSTISFTNLEPVDITGMSVASVASPPAPGTPLAGGNNLTMATGVDFLSGGTNQALRVTGTTNSGGTTIESVALWNNTTVVIDTTGTAGTDTITISSANNAHGNTNLTINTGAEAGDVITVNGVVTVAGTTTLNAPTINLNAAITNTVTGSAATVVNVDDAPSGQIQDGINVAATGATVNLAAGTYPEAVTVNKSLTLHGAGRTVTTIDVLGLPSPQNDYGIQVSASNVLIEGLKITNAHQGGINLGAVNNVTIQDNYLYNNQTDAGFARPGEICVDNVTVNGLTIQRNIIERTLSAGHSEVTGIRFDRAYSGANIQILNNEFLGKAPNTDPLVPGERLGMRRAILFKGTSISNVLVQGNTLTDVHESFYFDGTFNNQSDFDFVHNTVDRFSAALFTFYRGTFIDFDILENEFTNFVGTATEFAGSTSREPTVLWNKSWPGYSAYISNLTFTNNVVDKVVDLFTIGRRSQAAPAAGLLTNVVLSGNSLTNMQQNIDGSFTQTDGVFQSYPGAYAFGVDASSN